MTCKRCLADLRPKHFGNDRKCAFDENGNFTPDNWNCATLGALANAEEIDHRFGDESIQICLVGEDMEHDDVCGGFIVLSRYKHRGCCSSAIHVGDFFPPKPVTLEFAERILAAHGR